VIDDGKGALEGRLASSIPLRGSESATVCSDTHKHEGERAPLEGNIFIDTHMGTHRSPHARKIVRTVGEGQ